MPTLIVFAGGGGEVELNLAVQEEPSKVLDALNAAQGAPFRLTDRKGRKIWVNPQNIAYWRERVERGAGVAAAGGPPRRRLPRR